MTILFFWSFKKFDFTVFIHQNSKYLPVIVLKIRMTNIFSPFYENNTFISWKKCNSLESSDDFGGIQCKRIIFGFCKKQFSSYTFLKVNGYVLGIMIKLSIWKCKQSNNFLERLKPKKEPRFCGKFDALETFFSQFPFNRSSPDTGSKCKNAINIPQYHRSWKFIKLERIEAKSFTSNAFVLYITT